MHIYSIDLYYIQGNASSDRQMPYQRTFPLTFAVSRGSLPVCEFPHLKQILPLTNAHLCWTLHLTCQERIKAKRKMLFDWTSGRTHLKRPQIAHQPSTSIIHHQSTETLEGREWPVPKNSHSCMDHKETEIGVEAERFIWWNYASDWQWLMVCKLWRVCEGNGSICGLSGWRVEGKGVPEDIKECGNYHFRCQHEILLKDKPKSIFGR